MSTWRRKANVLFYDQRPDFSGKKDTIYTLFFILLPRVRQAHEENNIEELQKIYDFAEWCMYQKAKDLWNAAGVAFYEHLADEKITLEAIPQWIKPGIFERIQCLFQARMNPNEYQELVAQYNKVHGTKFP